MTDPIIAVYAIQTDRNYLLGYARGETEDILAYFDDEKGYGLELKEIVINEIPIGFAVKKQDYEYRKAELEQQLKNLNGGI